MSDELIMSHSRCSYVFANAFILINTFLFIIISGVANPHKPDPCNDYKIFEVIMTGAVIYVIAGFITMLEIIINGYNRISCGFCACYVVIITFIILVNNASTNTINLKSHNVCMNAVESSSMPTLFHVLDVFAILTIMFSSCALMILFYIVITNHNIISTQILEQHNTQIRERLIHDLDTSYL